MPTWKVFVVVIFGLICLIMGFATIIFPMTESVGPYHWLWVGALFLATCIMGTLFALFLRASDRNFGKRF